MKLIDILVEELPKRGGWPKGAKCITQDGDLRVEPATCNPSVAKCDSDGFWFLDSSRIGGFEVDALASDYTTAIITREQYEAALAEKKNPLPWDDNCNDDDGWIDWVGGKPPVDNASLVDIKFRDGEIASGVEAGKYYWPHTGYEHDIIAYRLHLPQQAEKAIDHFEGAPEWAKLRVRHKKDKDEYFIESIETVRYQAIGAKIGNPITFSTEFWDVVATRNLCGEQQEEIEKDLNDCIGQAPVTEWNGEGLPPVGCEFEYGRHRTKAKFLAVAHHMVFASKGNPDDEESDYEEFMISILDSEFHRVRTEAERKREEAVKTIMLTGWCQSAAEEIYDLIAAGKVPGIKLEG